MSVTATDAKACFAGDNRDPKQLIVRPDLLRVFMRNLVTQTVSGSTGAQGFQGAQGAQGARGAQGAQGAGP